MRRRWIGFGIGLGLWALAVAVKLPVLHSPPYWDEALHYWTARHLGPGPRTMTDLWGNPTGAPEHLVFQRPLFYLLLAAPAQGGFQAFRTAHALLASALAPVMYGLLRAHGVRRPAAILAGIATALVPDLAMWGTLGLMDSLMTVAVAGLLWARAKDRHGSMFVLAVAAVWIKETAYAVVLGLLAVDAIRGWIAGRVRLAPLELDGRTTAMAWAAALAPWPLMWAMAHDLALPGSTNHAAAAPVADHLFGSLWLLPVLLLGLVRRRSRFLAAFTLLGGVFLLALQAAGRDVPLWYMVPTVAFAVAATAATADAWWRPPTWPAAMPWPALAAIAVVALLVLLPNSPARDGLRPLAHDGGNDLAGAWRFERDLRDGDLRAVLAGIPWGERPVIFDVDIYPAVFFGPVMERSEHVYFDSSFVRQFVEVDVEPAADRIEDPATWTVVFHSDLPYTQAIVETYGDCVEVDTPTYFLVHGAECAGRASQLEQAWREHDPRF